MGPGSARNGAQRWCVGVGGVARLAGLALLTVGPGCAPPLLWVAVVAVVVVGGAGSAVVVE